MDKRAARAWNPLLKLLFVNALAGILAAAVVTAGLVLGDVAGFGHLVANASNPVLPVAVLFAALSITLSSAAMGVAVMRLPFDHDGPGSRSRRKRQTRPSLVTTEADMALATVKAGRRR